MRLSAIVVAFGKESLLEECVSRLAAAVGRVDGESELIVVLNHVSAVARERLERRTPLAVTVAGGPGLGFAGGVAAGLAVARGEWIALVNDDCALYPDALRELLAAGERDPGVGSVAAQIRFAARPDTINSAGIEIDELGVAWERRLGEAASACETEPVEVFGASAALALHRRAMLDAIGGLDASFFAYLEDADLAWRARMAGWRCVLAPRAIALHHHSPTLGHNRVRMLAKNASRGQLRRRLLRIVAYDLLYVSYAAAVARTSAPLTGRLRGLRDWRGDRTAGRSGRREIELSPPPGLLAALRRNRVYRSA